MQLFVTIELISTLPKSYFSSKNENKGWKSLFFGEKVKNSDIIANVREEILLIILQTITCCSKIGRILTVHNINQIFGVPVSEGRHQNEIITTTEKHVAHNDFAFLRKIRIRVTMPEIFEWHSICYGALQDII